MAAMEQLPVDLVLEGGGVKGIGLVGAITVLLEHGYVPKRVAGTSAGSIVGALVAARLPRDRLEEIMTTVDYKRFRDPAWIDRIPVLGPAVSILLEKGIYEGKELVRWLEPLLAEAGVHTFDDLEAPDAGSDLPVWLQYRLVVIASDISRGEMVRFPWDYEPRYKLDPKTQRVVDAVRASMSIPYFYEPVRLGGSYLVDGGLVSNFPVGVFDRSDGADPRWPTFGIKLSAREDAGFVANRIRGPLSFTKAIFATAMSGQDRSHIADPAVQRRTIFVDTFKVRATDFAIDLPTQTALYDSGRRAAEEFLKTFSFDLYVEDARRRHAGWGG